MELDLVRTYFKQGTNGDLSCAGIGLCHTIELPWKNNEHEISCIPEGKYEITKRYSPKLRWHLLVNNVPDRDLILIHTYNNAMKEAKGCIATVTTLTGEGTGDNSRRVFEQLKVFVFPLLNEHETVFLNITSINPEERDAFLAVAKN